LKLNHPFYGNFKDQEENKKDDPHSFLTKIVIPLGSVLVAVTAVLTSKNQQLPEWVFISFVIYLFIVAVYTVLIIGPNLKKIVSNFMAKRKKKKAIVQYSKSYLPELIRQFNEFACFMEDRSENIFGLLQSMSSWSEMNSPEIKYKPFEFDQLNKHVGTLREWNQVVLYDLQNCGPEYLQFMAYSFSRLVAQYHYFCLDCQRRLERAVREGSIQGEHLRYLKQEWFTRRERLSKFIDQWKPFAENINNIFGNRVCIDYFETIKTIE
jgi:hypothetical protein